MTYFVYNSIDNDVDSLRRNWFGRDRIVWSCKGEVVVIAPAIVSGEPCPSGGLFGGVGTIIVDLR